MKEFIEKLIGRLEELGWLEDTPLDEIINEFAEEYAECYKDCEQCEAYNKEKHYCPKWCDVIKNTTKEMVENESSVILMQLLEAKKNCSEDSDCSECPFGQIEDRCILAELQIKGGNNGWIPCSERLPEEAKTILICTKTGIVDMGARNVSYEHNAYRTYKNNVFWDDEVIAWQHLPQPYKK